VAALRDDDPEVDGLVASLATEIKTAVVEGSGRAGNPKGQSANGKDLPFNDAFLDALADRLANRIFSREPTKL